MGSLQMTLGDSLRLLEHHELPSLHAHLGRHARENGCDGDPIFSPFEAPRAVPLDVFVAARREAWSRAPDQVGWERCFGVVRGASIVGHLLLKQALPLPTAQHRAALEMGLERSARRRGLGSALLRVAIDWARATPTLAWIDLGVFGHNEPARALYSKCGFVETGRREDFFRVHGQSITDVSMSLRLAR